MDKFVIVFIDDILVYYKNKDDNTKHLRLVLRGLEAKKLYAKFKKCEIWLDKVIFLGHLVSKDEIAVHLTKIDTVLNWPQPKNVIEIISFLGLAGYYRRFVKGFAKIANPLMALTRKEHKYS